jgi:Na+/H+ antiporter NhaD/arsenite permease-like protein
MLPDVPTDAVLAIFAATYVAMALGRIPGLRTDRAGAAMVAATLMIALTGTGLGQAVGWIDLSTLALLCGLMVLSAQFGISGFYE